MYMVVDRHGMRDSSRLGQNSRVVEVVQVDLQLRWVVTQFVVLLETLSWN